MIKFHIRHHSDVMWFHWFLPCIKLIADSSAGCRNLSSIRTKFCNVVSCYSFNALSLWYAQRKSCIYLRMRIRFIRSFDRLFVLLFAPVSLPCFPASLLPFVFPLPPFVSALRPVMVGLTLVYYILLRKVTSKTYRVMISKFRLCNQSGAILPVQFCMTNSEQAPVGVTDW